MSDNADYVLSGRGSWQSLRGSDRPASRSLGGLIPRRSTGESPRLAWKSTPELPGRTSRPSSPSRSCLRRQPPFTGDAEAQVIGLDVDVVGQVHEFAALGTLAAESLVLVIGPLTVTDGTAAEEDERVGCCDHVPTVHLVDSPVNKVDTHSDGSK